MMTRTIFSGFGGQGVLSMGFTLANAAMLEGKYVTYLPSYGVEVRGGTANCTVVIADEEIGSPMVRHPMAAIAMNLPSLDKYESEIKPGGLLVVHTMDIASWFAHLMGGRWPWLMEMHIYYFSRRTLKHMLEKAGFTVIRVEPQGRYLRLGYFATRIGGFSPLLGRLLGQVFRLLHVKELPIPLNFGDLVTAYAIKR